MQTRTMSIVEIISGKAVGFMVAMAITYWIVPFFWGVKLGADSAMVVTGIYTAAAFVRSYVFRRLFNWITFKRGQSA